MKRTQEVRKEGSEETIIAIFTVPQAGERIPLGNLRNYVTSLKASKGNTGDVWIGKSLDNCPYVLDANEAQVTKTDLDKLFWKSENGTETVQVWAEKDKGA